MTTFLQRILCRIRHDWEATWLFNERDSYDRWSEGHYQLRCKRCGTTDLARGPLNLEALDGGRDA